MRIINVIIVIDGSVIGVRSYPIEEDQVSNEIVEKAESHFLNCCRENGADEEEYCDEYLLEEASYRRDDYEVCLTWSDIVE